MMNAALDEEFAKAKASFLSSLDNFSLQCQVKLHDWITSSWKPINSDDCHTEPATSPKCSAPVKHGMKDAETILGDIVVDLRKKLPLDSILPSEKIHVPSKGENMDCLPEFTSHVDAFLYDDASIDELEEQGLISRNYCRDCGSKKTEPLVFISHSASKDRLAYIFRALLPHLDGLTVLDVGSRLGATLYAAFLYTNAAKIIGVEMNHEFCQLQKEIVQKYGFQDKIEVIEDDIINCTNIVHSADVIILHNVFEFFLPEKQQIAAWNFLRTSIKPGAYIVTNPPLSSSFKILETGIDLNQWVQEVAPFDKSAVDFEPSWQDEALEVTLYKVL